MAALLSAGLKWSLVMLTAMSGPDVFCYFWNRSVKLRKEEPRPRWEVLRVLNYLVIGLFVCSITYVLFNYRTISHADSGNANLFPILIVW